MCLLCLYRFSELLEAVLGDFLFNGRCDVYVKQVRELQTSHRPLKRISPKTASRRHSKHTTGKGFQTLFLFLGTFHEKLPIIYNRISAPYKRDLCFVYICIILSLNILSRFSRPYILGFASLNNSIDSRTSSESLEG